MKSKTTSNDANYYVTICPYCGEAHDYSGQCRRVKAIVYRKNGTVKRVEFFSVADYCIPIAPFITPPYKITTSSVTWNPDEQRTWTITN